MSLLHYRAHEYLQKSHDIPCVWYKIKINQVGKTSKFNLLLPLCAWMGFQAINEPAKNQFSSIDTPKPCDIVG